MEFGEMLNSQALRKTGNKGSYEELIPRTFSMTLTLKWLSSNNPFLPPVFNLKFQTFEGRIRLA